MKQSLVGDGTLRDNEVQMGDGRWAMGDGRWAMGDGRWAMGDGRWAMGDGRWAMGDGRSVAMQSQLQDSQIGYGRFWAKTPKTGRRTDFGSGTRVTATRAEPDASVGGRHGSVLLLG
jgi:hypothetical protein